MKQLDKLNLKELKMIAKERGLNSKDAIKHGSVQSRATWVKLLVQNLEKTSKKQSENPEENTINFDGYEPKKGRITRGLTSLPKINQTIYFYGAKR